jgi:hypothetical protein
MLLGVMQPLGSSLERSICFLDAGKKATTTKSADERTTSIAPLHPDRRVSPGPPVPPGLPVHPSSPVPPGSPVPPSSPVSYGFWFESTPLPSPQPVNQPATPVVRVDGSSKDAAILIDSDDEEIL